MWSMNSSPAPVAKEATWTNQFLQDVWNEAVVTNRTDVGSVNDIAWRHLGAATPTRATPSHSAALQPGSCMSQACACPGPAAPAPGHSVDEALSYIVPVREAEKPH